MAVDTLANAARGTGQDPEGVLRIVRLPALMEISAGIPDITVALIDGPIARNHPDLASENITFLHESKGATCSRPESAACAHGTYVAGILHAKRDGLVPGICPGCRLLVRLIFSETAAVSENDGMPTATMEELATALREAIDVGARVINLSIGLAEASSHAEPAIDRALEYAAKRGAIVVAAAGNQGMLGSSAITRNPWVIPVVGCDPHGRPLAGSNLSASIGRHGLAAPGDNITSLAASGGHAKFSGSSAAVPFVSGTLALLWSVFPRVSATQLRLAISGSLTRRRSVTPPVLDASAAYRALELIKTGVQAI
jgi:subtilisin family serine protease